VAGEREVERLEAIAFGGEARGPAQEHERPLPSVQLADQKGEPEPSSPGSSSSA
jgi:hypothetical protein